MPIYQDNAQQLLIIGGLHEADRKILAAQSVLREYPKKYCFFCSGDAVRNIQIVLAGHIKLFIADCSGGAAVIRIARRGDVLGLMHVCEATPTHLLSAESVSPVKIMEIPMTAAKQLLSESRTFCTKMMSVLADEVKNSLEIKQMLALPASKRVAWLLLRVSRDLVGKGGILRLPYEKGVAAAKIGISAETFSRALGQLKDIGVASSDSQISIEDFDLLRAYVNLESSKRPTMKDRDSAVQNSVMIHSASN